MRMHHLWQSCSRLKKFLALGLAVFTCVWATHLVYAQELPPGPDVEDEPNDEADSATGVSLPVIDGHACIDPAGDQDHFTFTLERTGPLFAGVKATPKFTGPFRVALFDERATQVAHGDDGVQVPRLAAGKYVVSISAVQRSCYTLNIYSDTVAPIP